MIITIIVKQAQMLFHATLVNGLLNKQLINNQLNTGIDYC